MPARHRHRGSGAACTSGSPRSKDARRATKSDEVTYVSIGDGTTSEGEFWESLNSACTLKLPVVYLIEDNGYAISVPVEVQTPGGDISKLVASFPGLFVQSIDGTDFLASYKAMTAAVDYARARKGPAFVHAKVIRPYSHSLSDDEKLYKTADERAAESQARSDYPARDAPRRRGASRAKPS